MSRTLVFCTSFAHTEAVWTNRYRLWVNAVQYSEIEHEHILLVDDASPVLPNWPDTGITNRLAESTTSAPVSIFRFDKRLGRQGRTVYPGWYRSFCFAARFAEAHGFDRAIHIESDGFIISRRMQHHINSIIDDWVAPAILSHDMPESAIQVMAGTGLRSFIDFAKKPYSESVGSEAENFIPFTRIERAFIGSRYGETLHYVPRDADFVTQTNPSMRGQPDYYWWLQPEILPFSSAGVPPKMASTLASDSIQNPDLKGNEMLVKPSARAYEKELGSDLRHTGINYIEFLGPLSAALSARSYFEVGTEAGISLRTVRCDSVCVDPNFKIAQNVFEGRRAAHFFQMTSDEFFADYDLRAYHPGGVDLAFLDGLHHYEALLRDFINTERYCHDRSVILLHDCLPLNERMSERQQRLDENEDISTRDAWAGDVWKVLSILKRYRPDLHVVQLDCGPTGLVACTGLNRQSNVLSDNYQRIISEFDPMTLDGVGLRQLWSQFPTIDTRRLMETLTDVPSVLFPAASP